MSRSPVAVVCGDMHLSHRAPSCRADDWYEAMRRTLLELGSVAGGLPILVAGDVFDKYNPPPELINFAIQHMPDNVVAIYGQHDLPYHTTELNKSAYGTLHRAGAIAHLGKPMTGILTGTDAVYGYGWEQPIYRPDKDVEFAVALVHRYVCTPESAYVGAPDAAYVDNLPEELGEYDVVVTGDNHIPFEASFGNATVYNCGSMMIRKSNDKHRPSCGILYDDGSIQRHYFDTTDDVIIKPEVIEVDDSAVREFVESLDDTHEDYESYDFLETLENYARTLDAPRQVLLRGIIEHARND